MRKYFLELFAIGLVDSEGRINIEHMTSDALMTSMKTMEELTKMKMDRLVLETTMEMILCMFESCDTEEFTEIFGTLLPYAVEKNNDLFIVKDYLLYIRHDFGHVKSRRQKRPSHHAYRFCYSGSRPSYIMLSSP